MASFVQSHLNFCPRILIWGTAPSLATLFFFESRIGRQRAGHTSQGERRAAKSREMLVGTMVSIRMQWRKSTQPFGHAKSPVSLPLNPKSTALHIRHRVDLAEHEVL